MTRARHVALVLLSLAVGTAAGLLLLELALRLLPVNTGLRTMPVTSAAPYARYEPRRTFVYSRGAWLTGVVRGSTNNVGFVSKVAYDSQATTPLLAIVGDSYVQANMVPGESTLTAFLAASLPAWRVYGFGMGGAALSQYLAFAEYARLTFRPSAMVVTVCGNDFDQSLLRYYPGYPGFHYYVETDTGLALRLVEYRPSVLRRAIRSSALARYVLLNANLLAATRPVSQPTTDSSMLVHSRRAVDAFLAELPRKAGLPPARIALTVDATRPDLYDAERRRAARDLYVGQMRRYLIDNAARLGYVVIDLEQTFLARHERTGERFEVAPEDAHWSGLGHSVVADAVLRSSLPLPQQW